MRILKRCFDIAGSISALLLLAWLLIGIAFLVRLRFNKPVIFSQPRPGKNRKIFSIKKFRSMTDVKGENGHLLPDESRIIPFGRFLRRWSLDELPELWNVLKGDMSFVGPRPLLPAYLDRYTPEQDRRHEVKPGITGWAQVNGRNAIAWEQKFSLDVWYIDNRSFRLDLKIIAMTILKIFKREGIDHPGHATMEEFLGSMSAQGGSTNKKGEYPLRRS